MLFRSYTTDLLDLINVLARLRDLEPAQAKLLADVMAAGQLSMGDVDLGGGISGSGATGEDDRQASFDL